MRREPYAAYKSSGVEWLGDVPEHWEVGTIRRFALMRTGHTPSRQEADYWENLTIPWFTLADVWQLRDGSRKYIGATKEMISERGLTNSAAELLPSGTVVLSRTASVGYSGIMPVAMATSQDFWNWVCGPRLLPEFLLYALRAMRQVFEQATMGSTHRTIYQSDAAALSLCVPPVPEQHIIASFLDSKTGTLDTLISRKRELIEKLKEKRTALISRTVTRGLPPDAARAVGLDPDPKLKPTGVEWLGKVPQHWDAGNLRRFALMRTGHTPSRRDADYWTDCTIPWFTLADVWQLREGTQVYLSETQEMISERGLAGSAAELLPSGTVVLSRTASVGYSGIMPRPMATSQDFWNWICGPKLLPEFLLYSFRAMRQLFEQSTMGSTHKTIYHSDAAAFSVAVPPLPEQHAIASFLDHETRQIDALISKVEDAIARLQEYRAALITAAVTGKIDVRDCAAEPVPA